MSEEARTARELLGEFTPMASSDATQCMGCCMLADLPHDCLVAVVAHVSDAGALLALAATAAGDDFGAAVREVRQAAALEC